jgi:hypothetical protein
MTAVTATHAGCHDGVVGGNADASVTGPISSDDFPAKFARATCMKIFACCTPSEVAQKFAAWQPPITTEPLCELAYTGLYRQVATIAQSYFASGALAFDSNVAGTCVDGVNHLTCAAFAIDPNLDGACPSPYVGQRTIGASCTDNIECATGYCMSPHANGTCANKPTLGQPCPDLVCADGSTCGTGTNATCQPLKADGAACMTYQECASHGCIGANPQTATPGMCVVPTTCVGQ